MTKHDCDTPLIITAGPEQRGWGGQIFSTSCSLGACPTLQHSTAANDPWLVASFSARKNPQCIPANTLPVFPALRPRTEPRLLRLVTNGNAGQAPIGTPALSVGMRIDFEKEPDHQEMSKVLIKLSVNKFSQGVC
jgi:hypothetical protein